jgi:hypothetical protein
MTYKDNFVVEVKANGKILRVKDGAVNLPFGSEYSLLLKNLNSRRASVKIHIDGQDALDYSSLVLEPNATTELEGFLQGATARNRFKFIQKTKQIQDHRGDKIDDGLIRVEFAFEKKKPEILKRTIITEHKDNYYWNYNNWFSGDSSIRYTCGSSDGSKDVGRGISSNASDFVGSAQSINMVQSDNLAMQSINQPLQDEGITVKGSECNQDFRYTTIGELEQSSVITIQLKGISESGVQIERPVTVQTKLQCKTCGTKSKSSFKFCPNCGTFLE